jgi:hypothetical protein
MDPTGRRSEVLQKKLQRRNNALKPADFTKQKFVVSDAETKKDPVEKSQAALSDLRKRIDERKKLSKTIDVQQIQEGREEPIPELTGVTFSESPTSQRQEPSPKPVRNHFKDQDRYATKEAVKEKKVPVTSEVAPPAEIEVRSTASPEVQEDEDSQVSEITTDVRIMNTKGAMYAEQRLAGKLAKTSISTPTGRHLERDVNISVSNLKDLNKAVEEAKMDLKKQLSPVNAATTPRRNGLPYESTDYRPSIDEEDSWEDAIKTKSEQRRKYIAGKSAAKKLKELVKEAYSYEGDVFIDATEIREEDLDGEKPDDGMPSSPIKLDDASVPSEVEEEKLTTSEERNEIASFGLEMEDENDEREDPTPEESEEKPSFAEDPAAFASDLYKSSLGFFKSFSNQVDTQLKAFQERGLISKGDMDGLLGVLSQDVEETKSGLPTEGDDMVIFLGDQFEATACGSTLEEQAKSAAESNPDSVEKMLDSLKKSYNIGIAKCGMDSDLIKENTKAVEEMIAKLKKANANSPKSDQNDIPGVQSDPLPEADKIDGNVYKALSAQESMLAEPVPLTATKGGNKTFVLSVNMPNNE